jgi:hypothetical protein
VALSVLLLVVRSWTEAHSELLLMVAQSSTVVLVQLVQFLMVHLTVLHSVLQLLLLFLVVLEAT